MQFKEGKRKQIFQQSVELYCLTFFQLLTKIFSVQVKAYQTIVTRN